MTLQGDGKIVARTSHQPRLPPPAGARPYKRRRPRVALARYSRRHARPELLRRRQADDRLRRRRRRGGGRAPVRRQDRRGRARQLGDGDFALARYNPDGWLDTSFSGDGKQTTEFGPGDGRAAVAIQPDGKIVVVGPAGTTAATSRSPATTPNGSLDTSFSGDGKQTTDFGGPTTGDRGAIQGDGKIVVVGAAPAATSRSPATTRTARSTRASPATASRRPTSGVRRGQRGGDPGDGKIVAVGAARRQRRLRARPLQPQRVARHELLRRRQADDRLRGLDRAPGALQADGKIVAVGGPARDFALARYNPNGSLDTSFSGDGKQTTDFGGNDVGAPGWRSRRDGKIVAVGGDVGPGDDFALARYNPNGTLDTSFSGDGKQTTDFGGFDAANGVALQGDGKIVAVGRPAARRRRRFRARPLQPQRDARHELLRRRQAEDRLRRAPTRQRGWRSRATARSSRSAGSRRTARLRARPLQPDGTLDTSFSGDGKQTTDFGAHERRCGGAPGRRQDRRRRSRHQRRRHAVTSRSPATTPTAGSTRASPATASRPPTSGSSEANGVALQGDGKIVAVGTAGARRLRAGPLQPQRVARHELLRGRQADDRLRRGSDAANGVALQGDGKIVAVSALATPRRRLRPRPLQPERLARHELLGKRQADDRLRGLRRAANGVALQGERQDRRGRWTRPWACGDFALARYNANGRLTGASPGTAHKGPTSGRRPRQRGGAPGRRQNRRGGVETSVSERLRPRPLQPQRLPRHELLRRRQTNDRPLAASTPRTGSRSRPTARSSPAGSASAPTEPTTSALARYLGG